MKLVFSASQDPPVPKARSNGGPHFYVFWSVGRRLCVYVWVPYLAGLEIERGAELLRIMVVGSGG